MTDPATACVFVGLWALTPEAQAAWVQAIGSILAVLAAVFINWYQNYQRDRHERHELTRRGRALALEIREPLESWRACFDIISTPPPVSKYGDSSTMAPYATTIAESHAAGVPDEIRRRISEIYTLGRPGERLVQAIFDSKILREVTRKVERSKMENPEPQTLSENANQMIKLVTKQHNALASVLTHVVGMFD